MGTGQLPDKGMRKRGQRGGEERGKRHETELKGRERNEKRRQVRRKR